MSSDPHLVFARDVMERALVTVTPSTSILDVHRLFVEEEIHGAPVVDDNERVVGVVSSLDLLRLVRDELEPGAGATASLYYREELPYSSPDWARMPEDLQDRMATLTVGQAMTRELVTVGPDASIADVARTMVRQHVHRVLVLDGDALVGLISAFDLLRTIGGPAAPEPVGENLRHTGYAR